MLQRALQRGLAPSLHVAIIMDGNGRWAQARGLPRTAGHRAGADAVRRTVEAAGGCGIGTLTLFAFSSDNWQRPAREVWALMRLLHLYLETETEKCVEHGIRVKVLGRRDRLSLPLRAALEGAERATASGRALELRIAIDYSSRDAILRAAEGWGRQEGELSRERFAVLLGGAFGGGAARDGSTDVDLLIRTGGEQRLSDFLLWECAYAELYFTERMWPDFGRADLERAVSEFYARDRRFGRVAETATAEEPLRVEAAVQ